MAVYWVVEMVHKWVGLWAERTVMQRARVAVPLWVDLWDSWSAADSAVGLAVWKVKPEADMLVEWSVLRRVGKLVKMMVDY